MAGQQWEYGTAHVTAQTMGQAVTSQGTVGPVKRMVVIGTSGSVPPHDTTPQNNGMPAYLDQAGDEGWELTATLSSNEQWFLVFKRPKGWTK